MERYLDAVAADIRRTCADVGVAGGARSVFVGGGTPSLVPGPSLARALAVLPIEAGAEVTVECNPDTVTEELLTHYRAAGVNRVSFGVQSMVPSVLDALGRTHDPANVVAAVHAAQAVGFDSFNVDLIYGAAGETLDQWRATLDAVLALDPPHISAYGLTVEPGTPLATQPRRHPDSDDQADKYLLATEVLAGAGLEWYEISNWARPGHECRHNQLYWDQGDYLAFGCAAHGHRRGRRWWNVRTPERYIDAIDQGRSPEAAHETLDDEMQRIEAAQLALRTSRGVAADALPDDDPALDGLIERRSGRAHLTVNGRLLANEVALRLR
jgi:putative oxygen-independent coproporphyrinogen III oxidase